MNKLGFTPKHMLIADRLREYITGGKIRTGERLKPDTELALEYGVNKQTVANGMAVLVEEGLISRSPGRGTVALRNKSPKKETRSGAVGVILYSKGHVWQDMAQTITKSLMKRNLYPIFICEDFLRPYDSKQIQKFIEGLIQDNVFGLIVDGDEEIPFDFLKRNLSRYKNLVFIDHFQSAKKIDGAKYVLTDYEEGGRRAALHLIEKGHKTISLFGVMEKTKIGFIGSPQQQMLKGMKDVCKMHNIHFIDEIPVHIMNIGYTPDFYKRFAKGTMGKPTGALVIQDSTAINELLPNLRKTGFSLPEDLSLIGFFNTPWSTQDKDFQLSSFSIKESFQAETAVKMLYNEIKDNEIIVKPELIERDSVISLKGRK